jgi:glutamate/aspartate transport system permease protein
VFRNIPVLVQMFLWYFVLPELLPVSAGDWMKQLPPPWSSFLPALVCLGLYTASRIAEQVRAGIEALPKGQREAAAALGLGAGQVYVYVIVPQALRLIVPSLTSEAMAIYKNTSVALTIGLLELTAEARQISEQTFQTFSAFGAATIMYLILALGVYQIMNLIDAMTKIPGAIAGPGELLSSKMRFGDQGATPLNGLDFSIVLESLPFLGRGLQFSLALTAVACVAGISLGTVLALAQHFKIRGITQLARAYIATIRSIPLILVVFWFFFLVPIVLGRLHAGGHPVPVGPYFTAFVTFSLFEAAYYSEIIRVGLRSVHQGQFEASKALGLSTFDTYASVIMPQAFRVASPIILSQTIILFQDTSLVYVLSLTDLVGAASKLAQLNGRLVEMYLTVAAIYLVLCVVASQFVSVLRRRSAIPSLGR